MSFFRVCKAIALRVLSCLPLAALTAISVSKGQCETPPNLVLILADDMGYGDVQANRQGSTIPTPHLDRLAEEGMRFTDAHTPSAVCTPTRYGLMTGRYCWRSRLKRGVLNGYSDHLIQEDRLTLARFLKGHGYHTGVVGKWHLGLDFKRLETHTSLDFQKPVRWGPNDFGFNESFVIPASLDFPPYVYIKNQQITTVPETIQPKESFPAFLREGPIGTDFIMEDCLDRLTDEVVGFLERNSRSEQPFFLYFPMTAPHKPVLPHSRFLGKTDLGPYGDFIVQCDAVVGRVLKSLDSLGLCSNTMVVFTSDNGSFMRRLDGADQKDHVGDETIQAFRSDRHRANGSLRGTKADIWEAGHRVPFMVRYPGKITAGSVCDVPVCLTDYYATVADLLGRNIPENAAEDSFNLMPLLEDSGGSTYKRAPVINHSSGGMFAIRSGQWKLVLGNGSGGREAPKGRPFEKPYQLFDLNSDIGERRNVIDQNQHVAKELEQAFWKIHDSGRSR